MRPSPVSDTTINALIYQEDVQHADWIAAAYPLIRAYQATIEGKKPLTTKRIRQAERRFIARNGGVRT